MPVQQSLCVVLHKLPTGLQTASRSSAMAIQTPVPGPGDSGDISAQVRPSQQLLAPAVQLLSAAAHISVQIPSSGSVAEGAQVKPEQQLFTMGLQWPDAAAQASMESV